MKQAIISSTISLVLSLCLLLGETSLQQFAVYVIASMTAIASLGVLCGIIKDDVAARIRKRVWVSGASTAVQLYALIASGHPVLAAVSFMVSFFIVALAFKADGVTP